MPSFSNSANRALQFISTLIAIASVFAVFYSRLLASDFWCTIILAIVLLLTVICYARKDKSEFCAIAWCPFFVALLLLSVARISMMYEIRFNHRNEYVADVTEGFVESSYLQDTSQVWILKAFEENNLVLLLVDSRIDTTEINETLLDVEKVEYGGLLEERGTNDWLTMNFMSRYGNVINSKYNLALAYGPCLKKDWNQKRILRVPESALLVAKGLRMVNSYDFAGARALWEKADSMGNAAAAFYLYKMYAFGWGCDSDQEKGKGLAYLKKAANKGSRSARYVLGKQYLSDSESSQYDIGKAIDYLSSASVLNSVATSYTVSTAFDANWLLSQYYRTHHRAKSAYRLTSKFLRAYDDPDVRCTAHLVNCLKCKKYDEAKTIIKLGEANKHPYCYLIHAQLLMSGEGMRRDSKTAESLLKIATDSLNYSNAFHMLATLYRDQGRPGYDFFEKLDSVNYNFEVK